MTDREIELWERDIAAKERLLEETQKTTALNEKKDAPWLEHLARTAQLNSDDFRDEHWRNNFASQALVGLLSGRAHDDLDHDGLAKISFEIADAMMRARDE